MTKFLEIFAIFMAKEIIMLGWDFEQGPMTMEISDNFVPTLALCCLKPLVFMFLVVVLCTLNYMKIKEFLSFV